MMGQSLRNTKIYETYLRLADRKPGVDQTAMELGLSSVPGTRET